MILAVPLCVNKHCIRFRSTLNGRIFSVALDESGYEFVELIDNRAQPEIDHMRHIYHGINMTLLWRIVVGELLA